MENKMENSLNLFQLASSLENKTTSARRDVILELLKSESIDYQLIEVKGEENLGYNIVINIPGESEYSLIVGAHYDVVDKAGGANDNGSGVSILISLIKRYYRRENPYSLTFVLFDWEEKKMLGSKAYVSNLNEVNIIGFVNLDMCGDGNTVVFDHKNDESNLLYKWCVQSCEDLNINHQSLMRIPPGDDVQFEKAGIPSISLAIIPEESVDFISNLAKVIHPFWDLGKKNRNLSLKRLKTMFKLLFMMNRMPEFVKRMHTPKDTSAFISEKALETVYQCVSRLIDIEVEK